MAGSIYRSAAVERLSNTDRLDQPVRITPVWAWCALTALLMIVIGGSVASVVIRVPEKVQGNGIIISSTGILEVAFPSSGRLASIDATTGEHVKQGNIVAHIEQPELRRRYEAAMKTHQDFVEQLRKVTAFHAQVNAVQQESDDHRRRDLGQTHAMVRKRLGFLQERASIDAELGSRHLITRAQIVDTKVAIGSAEEELAATDRQISDIVVSQVNARIRDEREVLELNLKIDAAARDTDLIGEQLRRAEEVASPYSGVVAELKQDAGQLVVQGTALMTLLPDPPADSLIADVRNPRRVHVVLFVPGTEGKKITPGMTVEVTPSTVRREEYGFMFARVTHVAEIPATVEGMQHVLKNQQLVSTLSAGGAPFEVDIELLPNQHAPSGFEWSSAPGPTTTVSPGTLANGRVWVRRLRLIEFAIPATRGLFGTKS